LVIETRLKASHVDLGKASRSPKEVHLHRRRQDAGHIVDGILQERLGSV